MLFGLYERVEFWMTADRIGPDIPSTHWMLYFKRSMVHLCKQKFKHFHKTAEFRPGAYAIGCSRISIGKRVVIRPCCMLHADTRKKGAGIIIEDDVLIGSNVHIYVDKHTFDNPKISIIDQGYEPSRTVVLKKGCWIGANCTILPGVTVGKNSVVGAGSIVTKSVPPRTVAVGNPARVIKKLIPKDG